MQKTPFKVATIVLLGVVLGAACSIPIQLPTITPSPSAAWRQACGQGDHCSGQCLSR